MYAEVMLSAAHVLNMPLFAYMIIWSNSLPRTRESKPSCREPWPNCTTEESQLFFGRWPTCVRFTVQGTASNEALKL